MVAFSGNWRSRAFDRDSIYFELDEKKKTLRLSRLMLTNSREYSPDFYYCVESIVVLDYKVFVL